MIHPRAKLAAGPGAISRSAIAVADGAPLPAEIGAYAAEAASMNPLEPTTEEGIERLWALGYAD